MILPFASIEDVVFSVVEALEIPVLIAALVALAISIYEIGTLVAEIRRRSKRTTKQLEAAADAALGWLASGNQAEADAALRPLGNSPAMIEAINTLMALAGTAGADNRIAKCLADFDLVSLRRLERTRILVRVGPALGLMGTLIPLSPALAGLANGDVKQLSDNLRVAFSITVVGLLTGAIAFAISLIRDRLYAQDLSDLEYIAALLTEPADPTAAPTPKPSPATV